MCCSVIRNLGTFKYLYLLSKIRQTFTKTFTKRKLSSEKLLSISRLKIFLQIITRCWTLGIICEIVKFGKYLEPSTSFNWTRLRSVFQTYCENLSWEIDLWQIESFPTFSVLQGLDQDISKGPSNEFHNFLTINKVAMKFSKQ